MEGPNCMSSVVQCWPSTSEVLGSTPSTRGKVESGISPLSLGFSQFLSHWWPCYSTCRQGFFSFGRDSGAQHLYILYLMTSETRDTINQLGPITYLPIFFLFHAGTENSLIDGVFPLVFRRKSCTSGKNIREAMECPSQCIRPRVTLSV